jgi:hypothetical protein
VERRPATVRERREAQGRARRPPRRDRRGARDQRRGLREVLHPKGRPVDAAERGGIPGPTTTRDPSGRSRPVLRAGRPATAPPCTHRRRIGPSGHPRHHRGGRALSPTAWSWPATDGPPRSPDQPPHDREGLPGRPLVRRGDRRRRRPGHRDGQAVPAPARALREGRGQAAQPRGQGQPAVPDGPPGHLPAAMQGLASCPSSPATTCGAPSGRLFQYDVTGGRYEEATTPARARAASTPPR